jgi:hypothetical protein
MRAVDAVVPPRVPGLGWYALAGMVFLAGLALAAVLVWRFVAAFEPAARFLAPGEAQVSVAVPGDYIVWHEHRTVYQGRSFSVEPAMPDGIRYRVQAPDGASIAVEPHSGMSSEGSAGRSVSVAQFQAPIGGAYRVSIEGAFEPRVMAVGPNRVWPIMKLAGEASAIVILALGLAVAVGLYGFLRTVEAPATGVPSAEAETSLRQLAGLVYGLRQRP